MREPQVNHSETTPCPYCGTPLPIGAQACTQCDWVIPREDADKVGSLRDFPAAGLSLIPGLGHLFKGHLWMGLGYFFGTLLVIFVFGPLGMVAMGFQLLLIPFYWLWVMLHAFLVTDLKFVDRHIPTRMS